MGLAGRLVIWFAVGVGLWSTATWTTANTLGHVCVLLAGALAFPAAAGVGPFGPERSLNREGLEAGLDSGTAALLRLARAARAAVLLAALAVTGVPQAQTQPVVALILVAALFLVAVLLLRRVVATLPRTTLLGGVRWSLARALPLAAAGLLVLGLVQ